MEGRARPHAGDPRQLRGAVAVVPWGRPAPQLRGPGRGSFSQQHPPLFFAPSLRSAGCFGFGREPQGEANVAIVAAAPAPPSSTHGPRPLTIACAGSRQRWPSSLAPAACPAEDEEEEEIFAWQMKSRSPKKASG